ncbi:hypothetical protein [Geomonas propionica]|uniref:Uncharacterized protein n=1 Tax=Geomonas propionica TaxID=2798582 RepID=A0ABS0YL08_9BACT|nr:hypothetical protein [Geomonas propionica]MBJ6798628.1 hypothetical protein [Geomonas propionica]
MRKQETITIGGMNLTISEISAGQVYRLLQGETSIMDLPLSEVMNKLKGLVPLVLGVDLDQLLTTDIYSGDLEELFKAFKRTNPVFFTTAKALKLDSIVERILQSTLTNFMEVFVASLPQVDRGSMDTAS